MQNMLQKETDINQAVSEFYGALNRMFMGETAPMAAVWSHADDVTFLGPQGNILVGWKNISQALKTQAEMKLGGKIEPQEIHVIKLDNVRIVQNYEMGENKVNGKTEKVKIRATNIFRKEDGKWKLISHQTDLLPFLSHKLHG